MGRSEKLTATERYRVKAQKETRPPTTTCFLLFVGTFGDIHCLLLYMATKFGLYTRVIIQAKGVRE
jgi:hypothetical protein